MINFTTYLVKADIANLMALFIFVEKLNNIVIKKSETNNKKVIEEKDNEKVNKMKEVVSKDIKETSTGNRTYRDVCVIGK